MKPNPANSQFTDTVWKSESLVRSFLEGVRGAIPQAQVQIEVMLQLLGLNGRGPTRFVDLGCGDGVLGAAILAEYPEAQGVFADFSQPMLDAARQKLAACEGRFTLASIDYGQTRWPEALRDSGPFDAIVSGFSIHHQPDERKREIYREIHNLLAPGGWFINVEHVAPACPATTRLFDEAMLDGLVRLREGLGEQADREALRLRFIDREDKSANILAPVEDQCRWLRALGFEEVDCFFKVYELAVFGGRKVG